MTSSASGAINQLTAVVGLTLLDLHVGNLNWRIFK